MRKYLLATVSALAVNCSAHAADLPVKAPAKLAVPPVSWAGFYIGAQGGIVSHRGQFDDFDGLLLGSFATDPPSSFSASKTGGIVGGHAGYNWQADRLVFGLEGDISGLWAKASAFAPLPADPGSTISFNVDWLATIRGRIGVAVAEATLLYATGGVAFGHVQDIATQGNAFSPASMISDKTKAGWTIGGGIEHMFAHNWTARAEARYVDLGKTSVGCSPPTNQSCIDFPYRGEFSNKLLMGLVGVSLKF